MLKLNLILQIMNQIDHYQNEKNKKVTGLGKVELGETIITKFVGLREKLELSNKQITVVKI